MPQEEKELNEVVSSSSDKTVKGTMRVFSGRKKPLLIALIFLLFAVTAVFYINHRCDNQKCAPVTDNNLVSEAAIAIASNDRNQQEAVTQKIQKIDRYNENADYLYAVTLYYANTADYLNAQKYYNELTKVYNPKKGFALVYHDSSGLNNIKARVDGAKQVQQQAQASVQYTH